MQLGARNTGVGVAIGGLLSFVLFRSPAMRLGMTGLTAGGFGGWSAKLINDEFEKPPR